MHKNFYRRAVASLAIAALAFSAHAQIVNPSGPAQAGTGLSQAGSVLNVVYGTTAGTAKQGNAVTGVAQGGTGLAAITPNAVMVGNGTSSPLLVGPSATAGQVLTSTGASTAPTFQTPTSAIITSVFGQTGAIPNLSGDATTSGSSVVTLANTAAARTNIGLGAASNPTFSSVTAGTFTGAIAGTAVTASGGVSGVGFNNFLASPPPIGSTAPNTGAFTTLATSGKYSAGAAIDEAALFSVSSAATTLIGAATSNNVTVTGTTTITAFDNYAAGAIRNVKFAGALTLTYNATSLILPGKASITTAAGDQAIFRSLGSGNWECISYVPANGQQVFRPPAFSAYIGGNYSLSNNVATVALFNTVEYDTASAYNTATWRYTPPVAGYYQLNTCVYYVDATLLSASYTYVYKNGIGYKLVGGQSGAMTTQYQTCGSVIVAANGTTDYFQVYSNTSGTAGVSVYAPGPLYSTFNGVFLRGL